MQKYSITITEFYLVIDRELKIDTLMETYCVSEISRYNTDATTSLLPAKYDILLQNHVDLWFSVLKLNSLLHPWTMKHFPMWGQTSSPVNHLSLCPDYECTCSPCGSPDSPTYDQPSLSFLMTAVHYKKAISYRKSELQKFYIIV